MGYWLARQRRGQQAGLIQRFDPRFWTVNFPRPMMAAVTTPARDTMRVDCVFYRQDDLAGLIWDAADRYDHPLLAYEADRDFRDCVLSFRWRSAGVRALDAINGPVLTIEGRDQSGAARAWYVRLWNYAVGTPEDAQVTIDFASAVGGFLLPGEADAVWAGDIDRIFISLVPPGYTGTDALLETPAQGWAELSGVRCTGAGAVIAIGDMLVPEHRLGIASGYDDSYHLTPARLLRNALQLGYRGRIVHYVGMSHYFRLEVLGEGLYVSLSGGALNVASAAWHADFAAKAAELGIQIVWSLSYELFDAHCWDDWKQRAPDGRPALTGWVPPSTLLSPCHDGAMAYLQAVARAFVAIGTGAGLAPLFQVGEPWWWTMPDGAPCLYDASAVAAFAPVPIATLRAPLDDDQRATLDAAGARLAASTAALCAAVRQDHATLETHLLTYLPTVLDRAAPEAKRANMPLGWAFPAFDILQLEDYDWVTAGDTASSAAGATAAMQRLGYPPGAQDYLSGFVLRPEEAAQWDAIDAAAETARRRGVRHAYVWALPQVTRDGFLHWDEEDEVDAFDDVLFPLELGREVEVTPAFQTAIVTSAGGRETRNAGWDGARTRYDAGPGIRDAADIATLLAFFRARSGPARGFRLRDPFDASVADVVIGTGDAVLRRFALVARYGDAVRRLTRPVGGSVRIAVDGIATNAFMLEAGGLIVLDDVPAAGAIVTASCDFDVPVRFAEDQLNVARATFGAGAAVSVPLIEIREA